MAGDVLTVDLPRMLTRDEEYVVWACLWANVRDVHAPVDNLTENQVQLAERLFAEWNELTDSSATTKELVMALAHGTCYVEDQFIIDPELAEKLTEHYDQLINSRS